MHYFSTANKPQSERTATNGSLIRMCDSADQISLYNVSVVVGNGTYTNATRLRRPRRTLHPIQRLPYELSTLIIQATLRLSTVYAARLIELTSVSRKWQIFLFSTPSLWSELYIDDREPDLLATLAVFVHPSGRAALRCVIYSHVIQEWAGIMSVLLPVCRRITTLIVRAPKRSRNLSDNADPSLYVVETFGEHFDHLPNIDNVMFDESLELGLLQLHQLRIPPTVHCTGRFVVGLPQIPSALRNPRLFDVVKYNNCKVIPVAVPTATSLSFVARLAHENDKSIVVNSGVTLCFLKYLTECLSDFQDMEHLMGVTTPYFFSLTLQLPVSQIPELVDCLRLCMNLKELHLEVMIWPILYPQSIALSNIMAIGLRTLNVIMASDSAPTSLREYGNTFMQLSRAFKQMYPHVSHFQLVAHYAGYIWIDFASFYLASLEDIECLSLESKPQYGYDHEPIIMHSLRDLRILDIVEVLNYLEAPNLLRLELRERGDWRVGVGSRLNLNLHL